MKTYVLSTVCGLALLAVSTVSTQAGSLDAPIRGDRFSYSQIGDIKGEQPVALDGVDGERPMVDYDGVDGEYPLEYDGVDGEHPGALDGIDGEMPIIWWLYF